MATEEEVARKRQQMQQEILETRSKVDQVAATLRHSLQSIRSKVDGSVADQESVRKLRDELRNHENELSKVLSVKVHREVECKNKEEYLTSKKTRIQEVKQLLQETKTRKERLAALISQKLHALEMLEERNSHSYTDKENFETALLWYKKVLGFRTEGGEGVKFFFNKIDEKDADKEFSFTILLEGDIYRMLQCNPALQDAMVLVKELNQTNGLFKFIRAMRKKFLAYAVNESVASDNDMCQCQDSSTITTSPPPVSEDTRGGSSREGVKKGTSFPTNKMHGSRKHLARSPSSVSATRRSPRFQNGPQK